MRTFEWDEILEQDEFVTLTQEALESPRKQSRWSWKRFGAIAACAAVVLGVLNYSALAAGADKLVRYLTGLGAVEEGVGVYVQPAPLEWTSGDWTYCVEAIQYAGTISVDVNQTSTKNEPQLDGGLLADENQEGWTDITYRLELLVDGEALKQAVRFMNGNDEYNALFNERFYGKLDANCRLYQIEEKWIEEGWLPAEWMPEGTRCYGTTSMSYAAKETPAESYCLRASTLDGQVLWEQPLKLVPADEQSAFTERRALPSGGEVLILVGGDGRSLSLYTDRNVVIDSLGNRVWNVEPQKLFFVGASGKEYPADTRSIFQFDLVEYTAPAEMEEPVIAIRIASASVTNALYHEIASKFMLENGETVRYMDRQLVPIRFYYEDLDWLIELPQ